MKSKLDILKGMHPGKFVERELLKRKTNKRQFALSIGEHPQTLGAIISGKRRMNVDLALRIEEKFDLEEGLLMVLQVHNDIKIARYEAHYKPDLSKIREGLFWDTTLASIDWKQMKVSVIKRILSRGNDEEINEIIRFYGANDVEMIKLLNHQI